ncbi:hypothetical protein SGPA1_70031 [Streptomyces misionensis JCM 4497]
METGHVRHQSDRDRHAHRRGEGQLRLHLRQVLHPQRGLRAPQRIRHRLPRQPALRQARRHPHLRGRPRHRPRRDRRRRPLRRHQGRHRLRHRHQGDGPLDHRHARHPAVRDRDPRRRHPCGEGVGQHLLRGRHPGRRTPYRPDTRHAHHRQDGDLRAGHGDRRHHPAHLSHRPLRRTADRHREHGRHPGHRQMEGGRRQRPARAGRHLAHRGHPDEFGDRLVHHGQGRHLHPVHPEGHGSGRQHGHRLRHAYGDPGPGERGQSHGQLGQAVRHQLPGRLLDQLLIRRGHPDVDLQGVLRVLDRLARLHLGTGQGLPRRHLPEHGRSEVRDHPVPPGHVDEELEHFRPAHREDRGRRHLRPTHRHHRRHRRPQLIPSHASPSGQARPEGGTLASAGPQQSRRPRGRGPVVRLGRRRARPASRALFPDPHKR